YFERVPQIAHDLEGKLDAQEQSELRSSVGRTLLLTGAIYKNLGQQEKAVESYRQAREDLVEAGARQNGIVVLGLLGEAYSQLGQPQDALLSFQQQQEEEEEQGIPEWQLKAFIHLVRVSDALGESDKSWK